MMRRVFIAVLILCGFFVSERACAYKSHAGVEVHAGSIQEKQEKQSSNNTRKRILKIRLKTVKKLLARCSSRFQNTVWGTGPWDQHYLRRAIAIAGIIVGGCIGLDTLKVASGYTQKPVLIPQNMQDGLNAQGGEREQGDRKEDVEIEDVNKRLIRQQEKINRDLLREKNENAVAVVERRICEAINKGSIENVRSVINEYNRVALRYLLTCEYQRNVLVSLVRCEGDNKVVYAMAELLLSVVNKPNQEQMLDSSTFVLCPVGDWGHVINGMISFGHTNVACMILEKSRYQFEEFQRLLDICADVKTSDDIMSVQSMLDQIKARNDVGSDDYKEHVKQMLFQVVEKYIVSPEYVDYRDLDAMRAKNELLRVLLKENEGCSITDTNGQTMLDIAIRRGEISLVQLLVMLGERTGHSGAVLDLKSKNDNPDKEEFHRYLVHELYKCRDKVGISDPSLLLRAIYRLGEGKGIKPTGTEISEMMYGCVKSGAEISIDGFGSDCFLIDGREHMQELLTGAQYRCFYDVRKWLVDAELPTVIIDLIQEYYVQSAMFLKKIAQEKRELKESGKLRADVPIRAFDADEVDIKECNARKLRLRLLQEWEALELGKPGKYGLVASIGVPADMLRRKWLQEYRATESNENKKAYEDFIIMISRFDKVSDNTLNMLQAIADFPRWSFTRQDQNRIQAALRQGARLDLGLDSFFSGLSPNACVYGRLGPAKVACVNLFGQRSLDKSCSAAVSDCGLPMALSWLPTDAERQECAGLFTVSKQDR